MTENISECCLSDLPTISDQLEIQGDYLEEAVKASTFSSQYFRSMAKFFRDRFYLPLNVGPINSFFLDSGAYASQFVEMLKGNNSNLDPTFPNLPQMIDHFIVRDIPVKVKLETGACIFQTRVIESKEEVEGKKLRFILFAFYDHQDEEGNPWNPLTTDELSSAPLEVLRAFGQKVTVHSMMTFSLGSFILDGLKSVAEKDVDLIPKTLILNRGLASIWKAATQLYPFPISYFLYKAVYLLGLNANPELETLGFFKRMQSQNPQSMEGRKVVVLEAKHDRYFSGNGALDSNFRESLATTGVEAYQASFFIPMVDEQAHHSLRMDFLINNKSSGTVSADFLPTKENESLPFSLVQNLMSETDEKNYHTIFITGGNKDSLDSVSYLQVAPLMSAFIDLKSQEKLF